MELSVRNLNKRFGGNHVLKGLSFEVKGPELIGLIGPNGAGKTTLTNILDGAITPNSGTVYLNGKRIDQLPPFEVARAGLGRTFQVTRSFRRMTVLENLFVPALAKDLTVSKDQVLPIYFHIDTAHPDNERFIRECEEWYGRNIMVTKSHKHNNQFEVITKDKYVNGPGGARCTLVLKKRVRQRLEKEMEYEAQVFGFEYSKKEEVYLVKLFLWEK